MFAYFNQFHMTDELETTLTNLISKKEGGDYICKVVSATIPAHTEEAYGYTGSVSGLSGADIQFRNEHYGRFYRVRVPAQEYQYIAVMESFAYQYFQKSSFHDKGEIGNILRALSVVVVPYSDGIFNSKMFYGKFPYLEEFFSKIDKWRSETGRVTIDDEVLQQISEQILQKARVK